MRVARALATPPEISVALASGGLSYSAVRELTRVATAETEAAWLAASDGRSPTRSRAWSPSIAQAIVPTIRPIPSCERGSCASRYRPRSRH
jgi:hypothetical protein